MFTNNPINTVCQSSLLLDRLLRQDGRPVVHHPLFESWEAVRVPLYHYYGLAPDVHAVMELVERTLAESTQCQLIRLGAFIAGYWWYDT